MSPGKVFGLVISGYLIGVGAVAIWRRRMPMTRHRGLHMFAMSLPPLDGRAAVRAGILCVAGGVALLLAVLTSA